MRSHHWLIAAAGLLLGLLSLWQIQAAERGLSVVNLPTDAPPVTVMAPAGNPPDRPVILVAHGFAASRAFMRGFGLTLAHAGYNVVLWDFGGHGANPSPLAAGRRTDELVSEAEAALAAAGAQGLDDSAGLAILGHSMGSGAALSFGQAHAETGATVAVSPIPLPVTPELPRNLLLVAGELETRFVANARNLLEQAGGPGGDPEMGTARALVVIPAVEHISILFSPVAHQAARDWLDAVFGPQPGAWAYTDRRAWWYGLGLLGLLVCCWALAPLVREKMATASQVQEGQPIWGRLGPLLLGAFGATLILWLSDLLGLNLSALLGVLVGGYLLVWFGLAGVIAALVLRLRFDRPSTGDITAGLLVWAALWIGVGWLGQLLWLHWLLIPERLVLWPLGAVLVLPWFLAVAWASSPSGVLGGVAWWLAHSLVLVAALFLALRLTPELGFLAIALPLFPILLGLHALASAPYRRQWPFALSGALFLSWLLLAVFPLQ